jgi:hypothetical protein
MRIDYLFDRLVTGGLVTTQSPAGAAGATTGMDPNSLNGSTQGTFFNNSGGTGAAPSTAGSGNPIISQDQSAFSQYVLGQTATNPVTIGNLAGVGGAGQATTIGQALQDFMDLPPSQLQALEMQLWDAGYYVDGNGQPVSAQNIRFGVPGDPASWTAFARALGAASSSGVSLTSLLGQRAQAGAGINNALPSAVTGGGHTYTIDLANPTTMKQVADSVFQSALGRNATASEVSDITSKLRQQETSQGLTQEQGAEQQSRSVYQTEVNQRYISYESQTNPNLGGQIPAGPVNNVQDWSAALLSYMNLPVTTSNMAAIMAWVKQTGKFGDGSFNPLGTQRPEGGSTSGAGGVQQFQNWQQGLEGTASMLLNGKYQGLVSALQNGQGSQAVKSDATVQQELKSWSAGKVSSLTVDSKTSSDAAQASFLWNANSKPAQPGQPAQPGAAAATLAAGASNPQVGSYLQAQQQAAQNTLAAGASNPQVGAYLQAQQAASQGGQGVSPWDVSQGQQPPNPGDAYISPVTTFDVTPATEGAQAYAAATTGPNRIAYAGNNYLNAYQAVLAMIKGGGPTA